MMISDLNYLEPILEADGVVSGGSTATESKSVVTTNGSSPDNSSTSRVQTLSISSDDPQAMLKAEKLLQTQGISITAI